jgi:hypothetical protein
MILPNSPGPAEISDCGAPSCALREQTFRDVVTSRISSNEQCRVRYQCCWRYAVQRMFRSLEQASKFNCDISAMKWRSWTIWRGSLLGIASVAFLIGQSAKKKAARKPRMNAQADLDKIEFHRQLREATVLREFAYSIVETKFHGNFERKDYIAFALFN